VGSADLAFDQFGLRLAFHPHAQSHVESQEQVEAFLRDTDPRRVGLCLDTGHLAYAGADPVALVRDYPERLAHVHLKNVDGQLREKVAREGIPFAEAVKLGTFCEPPVGAIDFAELRHALQAARFDGFGIVEQDMYPAPFDAPLPIAKRTRRYLSELGFG
jgi:inosose dehydratase